MKFSRKVGIWPVNELLNFGGNGSGSVSDRPIDHAGKTGKMCLGGGMHCPSASSYYYYYYYYYYQDAS